MMVSDISNTWPSPCIKKGAKVHEGKSQTPLCPGWQEGLAPILVLHASLCYENQYYPQAGLHVAPREPSDGSGAGHFDKRPAQPDPEADSRRAQRICPGAPPCTRQITRGHGSALEVSAVKG